MRKSIIFILLFFTILHASSSGDFINYKIVTGSKLGTLYKIGEDLSKYVAPDANINLEVLSSNGSIDNVLKLISPKYPNVKFAIVQSDVLQELMRIAKEGRGRKQKNAKRLIRNIRVLKPLFNEEIHILVRKDSNINSFSDLENKKIFAGKPRSGTLMTTMLIYKKLFGKKLKNYEVGVVKKCDSKGNLFKRMLKKLSHREIDAIVQVAGQPVQNLNRYIGRNGSKVIKFVPYTKRDFNDNLISNYYKTYIDRDSYHWIDKSVPTLATKVFLVTYNYKRKETTNRIKKFLESLNKKLPLLKKKSSRFILTPHLKWRQVSEDCIPALPDGWKYHDVVYELCKKSSKSGNSNLEDDCTKDDVNLGLCRL